MTERELNWLKRKMSKRPPFGKTRYLVLKLLQERDQLLAEIARLYPSANKWEWQELMKSLEESKSPPASRA